MDIVEKFGQLPCSINYEGCSFSLSLIVNGRPNDIRLVYALEDAEMLSPHREMFICGGCWENPFADGSLQGFLFLRENISDQWDLANAIADCELFLIENCLK